MFFKKKTIPDRLIRELSPLYSILHDEIFKIDGIIKNPSQIGVFIATIATLKIFILDIDQPQIWVNEFEKKWIDFIFQKCKEQQDYLDKETLSYLLQDGRDHYADLFLKMMELQNDEKKGYDSTVQLCWTLFTDCTDTQSPANFTEFLLSTTVIKRTAINIFNIVNN